MASAAKNWAYTSLAADRSVVLDLDGAEYEVVQFTASFAVNQIPEALCMLATGRDAYDVDTPAAANASIAGLRQMTPAKVYATFEGEYKPDGTKWPPLRQLVFDGYATGTSYQKVHGKVNLVVNLVHWLVDLTFGSCLSQQSHVSNPASLVSAAVMEPSVEGAGAGGQAVMLSQQAYMPAVQPLIQNDLWEAIKTMLCAMSKQDGFNPVCGDGGVGVDQVVKNDRALRALRRIEGPGGDCAMPYKYGQELPLRIDAEQAYGGVAEAIGHLAMVNLWHMTFWDLLVGNYCPGFGMAVYPAVDRAVVCGDLPGSRAKPWREVTPDEYDFVDQSSLIPRPLRAVVAHGSSFYESGANFTAAARGAATCLAGVYASKAREDGDGVVLYTQVPEWVAGITTSGVNGGHVTGVTTNEPVNTATTAGSGEAAEDRSPVEMADDAQAMLDKYAHMVFVREQLRGRNGTVSGKLRLDVGPGSKLKLKGDPERFLGGEDALAEDVYCEASRVTVELNAESRRAATAFSLTAMRNAKENEDDRTSIDRHPFFDRGVLQGMPLAKEFNV